MSGKGLGFCVPGYFHFQRNRKRKVRRRPWDQRLRLSCASSFRISSKRSSLPWYLALAFRLWAAGSLQYRLLARWIASSSALKAVILAADVAEDFVRPPALEVCRSNLRDAVIGITVPCDRTHKHTKSIGDDALHPNGFGLSLPVIASAHSSTRKRAPFLGPHSQKRRVR